MRRHLVVLVALVVFGAASAAAQGTPSVTWLVDDSDLQLRYGTGLDFAFSYEVRLVGGADPEGDATLTLETCENHRCTTSSLGVAEGVRYLRFGIDPSQYHAGRNVFTFTLTLTDNGITSTDTLTLRATVTRRPSAVLD